MPNRAIAPYSGSSPHQLFGITTTNRWVALASFFIAGDAFRVDNQSMELNGFVRNGVIELAGGATLPEGTPVTITCGVNAVTPSPGKKRVQVPLVHSSNPGSLRLTNERIAEIIEEEDIEYARSVMKGPDYDDSPWTDEESEALRSEALDDLGWEGMEACQDDEGIMATDRQQGNDIEPASLSDPLPAGKRVVCERSEQTG
jgi:hypothetical protein